MTDNIHRAILLQIDDITNKKYKILKDFSIKATSEFNRLWEERDFCLTFKDFHKKVYSKSKERTGFHAYIISDLRRAVWRSKSKAKGVTVKFNIHYNCKTFSTKSFDFVELRPYSRTKIAVPIKKNRNWQRYKSLLENGWACETYGLTPDLQIVAYLSKEDTTAPMRPNVLGVDVNSKCFAVTVLSPEGKVLHQDYFGKDIWVKRKRIFERKSELQSYADKGSEYAKKALRRFRRKEHNFVKNRIGEVVRDITDMALRYNADIAIEDLHRFSPKGKRFNREVMRIPFFTFKKILEQRCFDKNIRLDIVDAWHTSKFCSRCGAIGNGHDSSNYALFRCKKCGVVVNSDRNASKNIALKSLLERKTFQISNRRVYVNRLVRPDDVGLHSVAVQQADQHDGKPNPWGLGSLQTVLFFRLCSRNNNSFT